MALVPREVLDGTAWVERCRPYSGEALLIGRCVEEASNAKPVAERTVTCGRMDLHRPAAERALAMMLEVDPGPAVLPAQTCVVAVSGPGIGSTRDLLFQTLILNDILRKLGYSTSELEEGRAVVLAEKKQDAEVHLLAFSCDRRLLQGSLSCRGIIGIDFSMEPGAGWVDEQVAMAVEVPIEQARKIRENCHHLLIPQSRAEEAFLAYASRFIQGMWKRLDAFLGERGIPFYRKPIDAVWAGSWRAPEDFGDLVLREARCVGFPIPIRTVRYSRETCATAVARGCLEMARILDSTPAVSEVADEVGVG